MEDMTTEGRWGAWLDDTRIDPPRADAPAEEWDAWRDEQAERRAGA